jgi:hypothetical protein
VLLTAAPLRADHPKVKMVITTACVSRDGQDVYEDIARYVSDKLGHEARIISGVNYNDANLLLAQGVIDAKPQGGAGAPPIVISKRAEQGLRDRLENIVVNMHNAPGGRAILKRALLQRFDPADDANYDLIREMHRTAAQVGFQNM